jgi:hypothetical protein
MCTVTAALAAGQAVVGFVGQQQAANAQNATAAAAHQSASLAAQRQYEDEQRRYRFDAKATQMEGYDAVMRGRQAASTVAASAGASGFDMGSLSVSSILAAEAQKTAANIAKVDAKQEDLKTSYEAKVDSYEAQAQGRINSMPFKAGPNPLGLAINLAGAAYQGYKDK